MTPPNEPTVYDLFAYYYDLFYYPRTDDHNFYLDIWQTLGNAIKVLEVACGSGRLLVPMARAGMHITGIDISAQMLDICHNHLANESPETQARARLVEGDALNLAEVFGAEKFDLIILGFNTFQHFLSEAEQLACLRSIHHQLADNGQFIIAVNNPLVDLRGKANKKTEFWGVFPNPARNSTVKLMVSVSEYPESQKSQHRYHFYDQPSDDGDTELIIGNLNFYYLYYEQLEALLKKSGFNILHSYGNYNFTPFTPPSHNIIFICRK
jgi:SAM-dependent methyltransferase